MDDARRFLRYVAPGLLFGIETLVLLLALRPRDTWIALNVLSDGQRSSIGVVLAAVLASGGLGFLLSAVHHVLHWTGCPLLSAINHAAALERLRKHGDLTILDADTRRPITGPLSRAAAWSIASALWHQRIATNRFIGGADAKTIALTDHVHTNGTARVAAVFAVLTSLWVDYELRSQGGQTPTVERYVACLVVGALFVLVHWCGYFLTARFAERVIDEILTDALRAERRMPRMRRAPVATMGGFAGDSRNDGA